MTRQKLAEGALFRGGVTFSVYSDARGQEKIFPFDLIPRVISAPTWEVIERGLVQRVTALNMFLTDLYDGQRILKERRIPEAVVLGTSGYLKELHGIRPREGVFVNIAGIDLIRGSKGEFLVLKDNLRTPSGVSYVLENRNVMKRVLPGVFRRSRIRTVESYPAHLGDALMSVSPRDPGESRVVVLTPGPYNSAYFEHSFLARQMGCELVQGSDLFVHDLHVYVKTTAGPQRVDVIYRRIDDEFLDPRVFREDSALGVPSFGWRLRGRERRLGECARQWGRGQQGCVPVRSRRQSVSTSGRSPYLDRSRPTSALTGRSPTRAREPQRDGPQSRRWLRRLRGMLFGQGRAEAKSQSSP